MSDSKKAKSKKLRADELVHARSLAESRAKAQALIMAGEVSFRRSAEDDWQAVSKAGQSFPETVELRVASPNRDVGRGATKLRGAFAFWPELAAVAKGAKAIDVGASTGGFTQVLLENGAEQVLALDVGTHQLHERLRADPRVVSLEQQHVLRMDERAWAAVPLKPPFDMAVTDLSFISLTKILGTVAAWLRPGASWVLLVKPQFELEPRKVPKGVVRSEEHRLEAIASVRAGVEGVESLEWRGLQPCPIQGGDGNQEYLLWLTKRER